jgi:hypothetical protein
MAFAIVGVSSRHDAVSWLSASASKRRCPSDGLGEAIANQVSLIDDVAVSSTAITEIFERTLRQERDLLEKGRNP